MPKSLKKVETKVEQPVEEIEDEFEDLLNAKYITNKKLLKAYKKREDLKMDIDSMELTLELIEEELVNKGYEGE